MQRLDAAPLLVLAARLSGRAPGAVQALAEHLLQVPNCPSPFPGRAARAHDAAALQLSVTCQRGGRTLRLLGDPGAAADNAAARLAAGMAAIAASCPSPDIAARCGTLLAALPADVLARATAPDALVRVATGLDGPDFAIYVSAAWGEPAADWARLAATAHTLLEEPAAFLAMVDALRGLGRPVALGLESTGGGSARLILSWRLAATAHIATLGLPWGAAQAFTGFLQRVVAAGTLASSSLVLSAGFAADEGTISDVKLDICPPCIRQAAPWRDILTALTIDHGLADPGVYPAIEARAAALASIGFGLDAAGGARLDLCLKTRQAAMSLAGAA
jgi:hypothetical protein